MTRPQAPLAVDLELTDRCNLRCRHCMTPGPDRPSTLPTDVVLGLLDEFAGLRVHGLSLTGGEPTLHPGFAAIVRRAAELAFSVQVSTNAVGLRREAVEALAGSGAVVNVSLDGADPETHDAVRGFPGAFSQTCEGIRTLVGAGVRVRVETVVMRPNLSQVPRIAALAAALGAGRYVVNDLRVMGRAAAAGHLRVDDEAFSGLLADLPRIGREAGIVVQAARWTGEHPDGGRGDCSAAVVKCGVRADGTVVPCLLFPAETGRRSLEEAWGSEFFLAVAEAVLDPGAGCETQGRTRCPGCGGGCRAAAYAWSGTVTGPDPSCRHLSRARLGRAAP